MWVLYSLLGAFFQATEMAVKKKALQTRGMNNFIAFAAFLFVGLLFGIFLFFQNSGFAAGSLSAKFWISISSAVAVNVVATYFLYKALDLADLSYLMPFMTLTSLTVIIPPALLFKEFPSASGFLGIAVIVLGAVLMDYKKSRKTEEETSKHIQNRKALTYFLVTAICYTLSPALTKLAVIESSPLFATFLIHLLMGIAFGFFILLLGETDRIRNVFRDFNSSEKRYFIFTLFLAGISIAIANLSINYAYKFQDVAYVMAIKRIMPLFAFLIGIFYFKERMDIPKKIAATALMIIGAIVITIFG